MMLHEKFMQECIHRKLTTDEQKSELIYELVSVNPYAQFHYGIRNGHSFDQYWLYSHITPSHVLIQATKNRNGGIQLSIHGLAYYGLKNFIDFVVPGEKEIFLDHLKLFGS